MVGNARSSCALRKVVRCFWRPNLVATDLELDALAAVEAYAGRAQVEVNFDEAKELGLGHYQGRYRDSPVSRFRPYPATLRRHVPTELRILPTIQ